MAPDRMSARYQQLYALLLRLYSRPFRERFGGQMVQTFADLCRERHEAGGSLLVLAIGTFWETFAEITKQRIAAMTTIGRSGLRVVLATAGILLIPLVAMQFTNEVVWTPGDFVVAGVMLVTAGLAFEWISRRAGRLAYRVGVGLAIVSLLILVWANLAVGIIGSEDNPANLLYFVVLLVAIVGLALSRLRPQGMARALLVTAVAQALVPVVAAIIWSPDVAHLDSLLGVLGVVAINTFFVVLFVASALLLRPSPLPDPRCHHIANDREDQGTA